MQREPAPTHFDRYTSHGSGHITVAWPRTLARSRALYITPTTVWSVVYSAWPITHAVASRPRALPVDSTAWECSRHVRTFAMLAAASESVDKCPRNDKSVNVMDSRASVVKHAGHAMPNHTRNSAR